MATRERSITPLLRRVGALRHRRLIERDDDAYLRSNPETVRRINEAIRDLDEGRGIEVTMKELRAMLGLAK